MSNLTPMTIEEQAAALDGVEIRPTSYITTMAPASDGEGECFRVLGTPTEILTAFISKDLLAFGYARIFQVQLYRSGGLPHPRKERVSSRFSIYREHTEATIVALSAITSITPSRPVLLDMSEVSA